MMLNTGMMSSNKDTWETPNDLFCDLDKEFGFTLDVCALPNNAKCRKYFSPSNDGLLQAWDGVCWMNPPYGRAIGHWIKKAYLESRRNDDTVIVGLLPARTDTNWFHDYIYGIAEIRFIKGRLRFVGADNSAPFPSMIVVWSRMRRKENG